MLAPLWRGDKRTRAKKIRSAQRDAIRTTRKLGREDFIVVQAQRTPIGSASAPVGAQGPRDLAERDSATRSSVDHDGGVARVPHAGPKPAHGRRLLVDGDCRPCAPHRAALPAIDAN